MGIPVGEAAKDETRFLKIEYTNFCATVSPTTRFTCDMQYADLVLTASTLDNYDAV